MSTGVSQILSYMISKRHASTTCPRYTRLTAIAHMRIFVGASKDRLEMLAAAPASSNASHARVLMLLSLTLLHNAAAAMFLLNSMGLNSRSKIMLLGFDCVIIAVDGAKTLTRYGGWRAVHGRAWKTLWRKKDSFSFGGISSGLQPRVVQHCLGFSFSA